MNLAPEAGHFAGRGVRVLAFVVMAVLAGHVLAARVTHDFIPLQDGTRLYYTLTLPDAQGRYPVVLKYDPYDAGVESDPTWNDAGYAELGVNFRGTGCSQGVFSPTRTDIWGRDGAEVVQWAAEQPWSSGSVGMIGYSFTGVSQLATAAFAGPALKAIAPENTFPDFYRDLVYPGGIFNSWIPLWVLAGRAYVVGADNLKQPLSDPRCLTGMAQQLVPDELQGFDTALHPFNDDFWLRQSKGFLAGVNIPVLTCVNWQDTTVHSNSFDELRRQLTPATTWLVGANGLHQDCPTSRARLVRFFDHYLKGDDNGWETTPHVLLVHELAGAKAVRETLGDDAGGWQTSFRSWEDMDKAIVPVSLYLHADGLLDADAPATPENADSYSYPTPTANTPLDWTGTLSAWNNPTLPGGELTYTTPPLENDAEFLGSGSVDLWVASTATDTDVQVTLSEVRPDGQELYVENGWLRLSHRKLDAARSTALQPVHTELEADAEPLTPGEPVPARIEMLPFDHVFRAGSAIRLSIDAPGGWFAIRPQPATNTVYHEPGRASKLVLGFLPGFGAQAPMPPCGTLRNQPCRANKTEVPQGRLNLVSAATVTAATSTVSAHGGGCTAGDAGHPDPILILFLLAAITRCGRGKRNA